MCSSDYIQHVQRRPVGAARRLRQPGTCCRPPPGGCRSRSGLAGAGGDGGHGVLELARRDPPRVSEPAVARVRPGAGRRRQPDLSEHTFAGLARTQALSPDGRCRVFDATANGFVRGEGCGIVVLKRLSDARRDGDQVWADDPRVGDQPGRALHRAHHPERPLAGGVAAAALRRSRVEPRQIGFLECHGTGTSLGDPVEVDAIRSVFGERGPTARGCGSGQ